MLTVRSMNGPPSIVRIRRVACVDLLARRAALAKVGPLQSTPTDHYASLGLDRRCTLAQIRDAYRLLVRKHHPDVNPDSPEAVARTQEIIVAYEILNDPRRRREYDFENDLARRAGNSSSPARIESNISQDVLLGIDELLRGTNLVVRVNDPANPDGGESYELAVPQETVPGTRFRIPRATPFESGFVNVRVKARPELFADMNRLFAK